MNEKIKNRRIQYRKFFQLGLILSLLLHIFLLQGYKRLDLKPVHRGDKKFTIETIDVASTIQKKSNPPPRKPSVPLPVEKEELPDEDPFVAVQDYFKEDPLLPDAPQADEIIFVDYDSPPLPIGGFKAIADNLVYPDLAKKAGIEGRVVVAAKIGINGKVLDTRIRKSSGAKACDEAAVRAVRSVRWSPALQRDNPVQVWIAIPIDFKLKQG